MSLPYTRNFVERMAPKAAKARSSEKAADSENHIPVAGKQKKQTKQKKRKKSQVSPGGVMDDHAEKRAAVNSSPVNSQDMNSQSNTSSMSMPLYNNMSPNIGLNMAPYYMAPQAIINSQNLGQSPQFTTQNIQPGVSLNQAIMSRLDSIDNRLKSLSMIEQQLVNINSKISTLDSRVTENENTVKLVQRTVSDLEESRNFDSRTLDTLKKGQTKIERDMVTNSKLTEELQSNKDYNSQIRDDIVDLKGRSMRDNLLFYNFPEQRQNQRNEQCMEKLYDFCELELGMADVRRDVKIDRAHRIGPPKPGKVRPIVAKFNFYQDKEQVKRKAAEKLQNSKFSVGDQFPKEIQQRRRVLVPVMKKAQKNGHSAVLAYDKLYVDGKIYNAEYPNCVALVDQRRSDQRQQTDHTRAERDRRHSNNLNLQMHNAINGTPTETSDQTLRFTSKSPNSSTLPPGLHNSFRTVDTPGDKCKT